MSLTKLCGLYKKTDKRGDIYLTGALGLTMVCINRNLYKREPGEPDYYLTIIPNAGAKAPQAGEGKGNE